MDTLESDEQPCTEAYLLKLITAYYNIPLALMYVCDIRVAPPSVYL
jgi:hypothetical protein